MKIFLPLLFILLSSTTQAAIIIESISGYSDIEGLNINANANLVILGGFAGNPEDCPDGTSGCNKCSAVANTSATCNNCFRQSTPALFPPCNTKRAHDDMILRITFRSTAIAEGGGSAKITRPNAATEGQAEVLVASNPLIVLKEQSATVTVRWSDLCRNFIPQDGNPAYTSCEDPTLKSQTQLFKVGLSSDQFLNNTATSDSLQFSVTVRNIKAADPEATTKDADCTGKAGLCNFSFFPGDQKAFLENVKMGSSQIRVNRVHFMCAREDEGAFDQIYNWPVTGSVDVVNNSLASDFLDNLENGKAFSCIAASEDDAGNIGYFMADYITTPAADCPDNSIISGFSSCRQVRPDAVAGLFKDNCFIATAAYGSSLAPHVQTLKSFRNQYLNTNVLGRAFVKLYYKLSPPMAKWISMSESRRTAARWALTPVVFTVESFMQSPFTASVVLLMILFLVAGVRWSLRSSLSKGNK